MKRLRLATWLCCVSLLWATETRCADIRLARIFGDGMVLQRDQPIIIWGWADPNENISVTLHRHSTHTTAAADGKWRAVLPPLAAGGPYTLTVSGKQAVSFEDVLIGDVWICSGQSNMEWPVIASADAENEIRSADFPRIRHVKIPLTVAGEPQEDLPEPVTWRPATPEHVGLFTAVGYYFARELQRNLNIPIGLINTTWGGTMIETWTSREAFENDPEFASMIAKVPRLNLDSLRVVQETRITRLISQVQGGLPGTGEAASWPSVAFDDRHWPRMNVPGNWESRQLPGIDGVVWFRRSFTLTPAQAGAAATLRLGTIDDRDEVYINGTLIGKTNGYNIIREYTVPAGILRAGNNIIVVRIEDTGSEGGFTAPADQLVLVTRSSNVPLSGDWAFQVERLHASPLSIGPNSFPTLLFNSMVHPLIPYTIKGAIWYQGESNAGRAFQYRKAFPLLINDWRQRWGQGDFPFYFVQLASYKADGGTTATGSTWAELREAQAATLAVPRTGMAVTLDIGDTDDIHPRNKQEVGRRLALVAFHDTYGKTLPHSGPVYQSVERNGRQLIIRFTHTDQGLKIGNGRELRGFEIAGEDRQFKPAHAVIEGHTVVLTSDAVAQPVAARYAWADDAGTANLYNGAGLPAAPFRTDRWPEVTRQVKYQP